MKKTLAVISLALASSAMALPTFAATHEEPKSTVNPHKHEADKKAEAKSQEATKEAHAHEYEHAHKHAADAEKKATP